VILERIQKYVRIHDRIDKIYSHKIFDKKKTLKFNLPHQKMGSTENPKNFLQIYLRWRKSLTPITSLKSSLFGLTHKASSEQFARKIRRNHLIVVVSEPQAEQRLPKFWVCAAPRLNTGKLSF
jgi:hypothetical protein